MTIAPLTASLDHTVYLIHEDLVTGQYPEPPDRLLQLHNVFVLQLSAGLNFTDECFHVHHEHLEGLLLVVFGGVQHVVDGQQVYEFDRSFGA